ncbi:MAG TPA: response regulator [Candidatus Thermoplasmatota archaeon]|nr:response regulator [Candidatus Thermoplasmatota archaeon]
MTPTILAVDDEQDILLAMKGLLEGVLKVPVTTATSGLDGLRVLEQQEVALVISDFRMPGMNGLEFLARSFQLRPDVPRVMLTAFPDMELVIQAVNQARITQFLLKPVQPDSLVDTVQGILAESAASAARAKARGPGLPAGLASPRSSDRVPGRPS